MSCLIFLLGHIVLVRETMARLCRWLLCVMIMILGRVCLFNIAYIIWISDRSQWPRGLRRGSAAARLLGLRDRIQTGHGCECCVLSGRGLCVGLITRPEESCRVWCVCDREASIMRKPRPLGGCCINEKNVNFRVRRLKLSFFNVCFLRCCLHSACWRNCVLSVLEMETINSVTTNQLLLQNE